MRTRSLPEDPEFEQSSDRVRLLVTARCALLRSHITTQPEGWGRRVDLMSRDELLAEILRLGLPPWAEIAAKYEATRAAD